MKITEILIEAAAGGQGKMIRGMLVQTPEQFLKSNGVRPAQMPEQPEALDEANEWEPIKFSPQVSAKFTPQPAAGTDQETPAAQATPAPAARGAIPVATQAEKGEYSRVITPQELVGIVHDKSTYVVYYLRKAPDNPKVKKKVRITKAPIYLTKELIKQVTDRASQEVEAQFPDLPNASKKSKAYVRIVKELQRLALAEAMSSDPDLKAALQSGAVTPKQLKVEPYITVSTKVNKPAVHKSSVPIIDENNDIVYDLDGLAERIKTRPERLLKVNAKMAKSGGQDISIANIGIPAITGLVVDERTGEFRVVNTCPGAGICKAYCYATRGGYIQYSAASESQMRLLNFWFNDPEGFKQQLIGELKSLVKPGIKVYFRWHDSGDFFTNAYLDLAFDVARALPEVTLYAYTKIASVASHPKTPKNFLINFSAGAKPEETKQINFKTQKFSEVVPKEMFSSERTTGIGLTRLQEKNPEATQRMKNALANYYKINVKSILTYDEMMTIPEGNKMKYNVMVIPSLDGDLSAARRDVLGSYLLYH